MFICRVNLSTDQEHGKAYGRLVWRGRPRSYDQRIFSASKAQWKLLDLPDYQVYTTSLYLVYLISYRSRLMEAKKTLIKLLVA